jgi:hypothetical protein
MNVVDFALEDGSYDAFVVWADAIHDTNDDTKDDAPALAIDVTITTGAHKGEVVTVHARNLQRDALDLVGLPCTLHVFAGQPRLSW